VSLIARVWRGRVPADRGDAYQAHLRGTGLADYARTPGHRGTWVLRRVDGDVAEFLLLTAWESWDAIRAFAGDDVAQAHYYPEDADFLLEMPERVEHWELLDAPSGS